MTLAHICQHVVNTVSIFLYRGHWLPTDSWQRILENLQGHYLQENHPRYGCKENATFQQTAEENLIFQINIQEQLETSEVLLLIFSTKTYHLQDISTCGIVPLKTMQQFGGSYSVTMLDRIDFPGQTRFRIQIPRGKALWSDQDTRGSTYSESGSATLQGRDKIQDL